MQILKNNYKNMINVELNEKFEKLKQYGSNIIINKLNNKIYNLSLTQEELSKFDQNTLNYIHVKLHNSIYFKKPFNDIKKIKILHDNVIKYLPNHKIIDKLD